MNPDKIINACSAYSSVACNPELFGLLHLSTFVKWCRSQENTIGKVLKYQWCVHSGNRLLNASTSPCILISAHHLRYKCSFLRQMVDLFVFSNFLFPMWDNRVLGTLDIAQDTLKAISTGQHDTIFAITAAGLFTCVLDQGCSHLTRTFRTRLNLFNLLVSMLTHHYVNKSWNQFERMAMLPSQDITQKRLILFCPHNPYWPPDLMAPRTYGVLL